MIEKVCSVGDSVSVISRNTTVSGQAASIITFYRVDGGSDVAYRKNGFKDTNEVLSAWGNKDYQLYHTVSVSKDQEEIRVSSILGKVVT